jgi:hypothetical protein
LPLDGDDWPCIPGHGDENQSSKETWGFAPGLSYEDRIRTVLFEAGARRLEAKKAGEQAMADIREALHRGNGVLSVSEMSRLSGLSRPEIYRMLG